MSVPLIESQQAVVASNGEARARISNLVAFEKWQVTRFTVSSTSTVETNARVYRNQESPTSFIEGTYSGRQDSSATDTYVGSGESLLCVWTGATVGSRCIFTIEGERSR